MEIPQAGLAWGKALVFGLAAFVALVAVLTMLGASGDEAVNSSQVSSTSGNEASVGTGEQSPESETARNPAAGEDPGPAEPAPAPSRTPEPLPTRVPPTATRVPPAPTRVAAIATARSGPSGTTIPNGTWMVPAEVAPGTYRTRTASSGCYWARLSGFGGSDILANDNTDGPAIVTIGASDQGFQSSRCGMWTRDLSAITPSQTSPFRDGTYIVGVDIAPGTWRADTPSTCYWERVRGFSGGLREIIDNDNYVGIVTIAPSDRGFTSSRCGAWTKVR